MESFEKFDEPYFPLGALLRNRFGELLESGVFDVLSIADHSEHGYGYLASISREIRGSGENPFVATIAHDNVPVTRLVEPPVNEFRLSQ